VSSIDSPEFLVQQQYIGRPITVVLEEFVGVCHSDIGLNVVVSLVVKYSENPKGN
jgi:hypothetical protein